MDVVKAHHHVNDEYILGKTWEWLDIQVKVIRERVASERTWQLNVAQVNTMLKTEDGGEYVKALYESLYPEDDYLRGQSVEQMNERARDSGLVRTKVVSDTTASAANGQTHG